MTTEWLMAHNSKTLSRTRPQSVSEFFTTLASLNTEEQKVAYLQMNQSPGLLLFFRTILDDSITWGVDPDIAYDPCNFEDAPGLWSNFRRLYLWCDLPEKPSPLKDDPAKRNRKWGDFLSEHKRGEAEILKLAAKHELPRGGSRDDILMAFPNLLQRDEKEERRQNARREAEAALKRAIEERNRVYRVCADETSSAVDLIQAKRRVKEEADERIRRAEALLGSLS